MDPVRTVFIRPVGCSSGLLESGPAQMVGNIPALEFFGRESGGTDDPDAEPVLASQGHTLDQDPNPGRVEGFRGRKVDDQIAYPSVHDLASHGVEYLLPGSGIEITTKVELNMALGPFGGHFNRHGFDRRRTRALAPPAC